MRNPTPLGPLSKLQQADPGPPPSVDPTLPAGATEHSVSARAAEILDSRLRALPFRPPERELRRMRSAARLQSESEWAQGRSERRAPRAEGYLGSDKPNIQSF